MSTVAKLFTIRDRLLGIAMRLVNVTKLFCLHSLKTVSPFRVERWYSKSISTIYALSSGQARSAIAVVRISGPKSKDVLHKLTRMRDEQIAPRKALLRRIYDPEDGELLDNGLVLWFPQPNSFTGEDSVELHVHGGSAVVSSILKALQKIPGFRHANPGEFTKRSLLAGKLDATEVEGLADLLKAETESQRKQALRQANGELSAVYNKWRGSILRSMAFLEAFVDFGEDQDIGGDVLESLHSSIKALKLELTDHLKDNRRGERLRNGVRAAIIGEPNVGKSSLLNILSRKNVAIVSSLAGTTRDILEVPLDIGGYPMVLCDTAGLRYTDCPVESEGLKRAREAASNADLVIIVVDGSKTTSIVELLPVERYVEDKCKRLGIKLGTNTACLVLLNKLDLMSSASSVTQEAGICAMSCKTEQGLDRFLTTLQTKLAELCSNPQEEAPLITSTRQRHHLELAHKHLERFLNILHRQGDLALAGEHLRQAAKQISLITISGRIDTEEMLNVLFQSFCIGK